MSRACLKYGDVRESDLWGRNPQSPGFQPKGFKRSRPIFYTIHSDNFRPSGFATLISWARPRSLSPPPPRRRNSSPSSSVVHGEDSRSFLNYHKNPQIYSRGRHGSASPSSPISARPSLPPHHYLSNPAWLDYSKSGFTFFMNKEKNCNCGFLTEYQKQYNPQTYIYVQPVQKPWWNGREMTSKFDRTNPSCPRGSDGGSFSTYSKDYHWVRSSSQPTPLCYPQGEIERAKHVVEKIKRWDYTQRGLDHHLLFPPTAYKCAKCSF